MEHLIGNSTATVDVREANSGFVPRASVFGFEFDQLDEGGVVDHVFSELESGRGGWMITPNLHILRQATKDDEVARLLRAAPLVVMDGAPVEWAGRVSRRTTVGRTPGSTVFWSLCASAARLGRSVLLMGGRAGSAELAAAKLAELHPEISVGTHFPPFGFESDPQAMTSIRDAVRRHEGGLVFVGLGCPKQERLMAELIRDFPNTWFFGVGAAIDFASGQMRRAPMWMQRSGLEWAHRLGTEPRRLARRYLIEDLPFASTLLSWAIVERVTGDPELPEGSVAARRDELMLAHALAEVSEGSPVVAKAELRSVIGSPTASDRTRATALDTLVELMQHDGRYAECAELLTSRLGLPFESPAMSAIAHMKLGRFLMESGDLLGAIEAGSRGVAEAEAAGVAGTAEGIRLRATLADVLRSHGDLITAELQIGLALSAAKRLGDPVASGSAMWNAALLSAEQGRFTEALHLADSARRQFAGLGDALAESLVGLVAASILLDSGTDDLSSVERRLDDALAVIAERGTTSQQGMVFVQMARLRLLQGDLDQAQQDIQTALADFGESNQLDTAIALGVKAQVLSALGDVEGANEVAMAASEAFTSAGAERLARAVWTELAATSAGSDDRRSPVVVAAGDEVFPAQRTYGAEGRSIAVQEGGRYDIAS